MVLGATDRRRTIPLSGERRLPAGTRAAGWYQIGWSTDFVGGAPAKPLRYFGMELVGYRTESGQVAVAEAYCPHLGAHLGHGGTVEGDRLVCPFHGWEWNCDGTNAHIPYGPRTSIRNRLRVFEVQEVDQHVLVWFDPAGRSPFLDVKVRLVPSDDELVPCLPHHVLHYPGVTFSPQLPVENLVDFAHFKFVHLAEEVGDLESFTVDGGVFRTVISIEFGSGRPSTWMTPDGPVTGRVINHVWSVGFFVSRFEIHEEGRADLVLTTATTPIDDETSDLFISVQARGESIAGKWVAQEKAQTERDLRIWNHTRYLPTPPLVGDETEAFRALRHWTYQFYVDDVDQSTQGREG